MGRRAHGPPFPAPSHRQDLAVAASTESVFHRLRHRHHRIQEYFYFSFAQPRRQPLLMIPTVILSFASSDMSLRSTFLNPGAVMMRSYRPGSNCVNTNRPSGPVFAVNCVFLSCSVRITVAFGTAPS